MKLNLSEHQILVADCVTIAEFVKQLRASTGNEKINASTIHYHLKNTDNLDYVEVNNVFLIVVNDKAKSFNPGSYYKGRISKMDL
ncbi:MAG TPA: hypothetical protein PKU82_04495 [Bacteroidia bacterium]|nr:hypothetical protein [Bacteroidia bacterium]HOZ90857.1 hypothetical protein [Bacteroidia bacterium]HRB52042.1 hypothetical protein [Bacteroidia bacterium]